MPIRSSSMGGTPFGNTANRPSNPQVGQTYNNGELGYQEIYTNSGWIPASGGNDFNLNITGTYTTVTFSQSYASGSYSIVSSSNDATIDIYAYASDGSLAGYTATKAFTATQRFNKMVVIGGTNGDVLSFSYKTTFATSATTSEVTAGPFITSVSPSAMPNINDTITITGGNFATNVQVAFTGTEYASTSAKSIVRSSSSQLIVTRPDSFPISGSPYTITITNPGVSAPAATLAHISSNSVTAGTTPVWNTAATLPTFTKNISYSTTLSATDPDTGGSITYTIVSGSLPTGLNLSSLTGVISGTPTSDLQVTFTVRATDAGGNFVDRAFTLPNAGPVWTTTSPLPVFTRNSAYSTTLVATDDSGNNPTYSLVSGSLPIGITLSSAGIISGTPTSSTQATFTIRVTDANGNIADRSFTMPNAGPVWSTAAGSLSGATVSTAYSQQVTATDDSGVAPTYSLISGALPTGLSLSSSGLISGTATVGSNGTASSFTIRATDANGTTADRAFNIYVLSSQLISLTNTGTWTNNTGVTLPSMSVVVVAGGGSGAAYGTNVGCGGGGAGGVVTATLTNVAPGTSYSYSVGAGGGGITTVQDNSLRGNNGSNSTFGSLTTAIGGGGGGANGQTGNSGGSGGGGSRGGTSSGTAGQGNSGSGGDGTQYGGGGGGGIGSSGTSGGGGTGGVGGSGGSYLGVTLAAGGGGGYSGGSGGSGGSGIGGNGGSTSNGTNAAVNTGSGGGGSAALSSGSGSSGRILLSYMG